jgi:hypothetical protein
MERLKIIFYLAAMLWLAGSPTIVTGLALTDLQIVQADLGDNASC